MQIYVVMCTNILLEGCSRNVDSGCLCRGLEVGGEQMVLFSFCFQFKLFILCWSVANQQCCGGFRWTAKGLSHKCTKDTPEKGLLSKIYKELSKLSNKKTTQFKNWLKILADSSPKKVYRWQKIIWQDAPYRTSSNAHENNNEISPHIYQNVQNPKNCQNQMLVRT